MDNNGPDRWLTNLVALAVTAGWIATLLEGFFVHNFTALTITTPLMLALAGYAFGIKIIQRQRDRNGNGNGNTKKETT